MKTETDEIKKDKTTTLMMGDSNLRCINESGVMASVTSITGGKIGHIVNQTKFIDLANVQSIVLSAGQNNVGEVDDFINKEEWSKKLDTEIERYEKTIVGFKNKGKNVFVIGVPPTPVTQETKKSKAAREEVNRKLCEVTQRLIKDKKSGAGMVAYISEQDGNFNKQIDFSDERHLSERATVRILTSLDNILPEGQKLFSESLKGKATTKPYRGCYGTFPVGCRTCTMVGHSESSCKLASKKRNRSTGDEQAESSKKHKL